MINVANHDTRDYQFIVKEEHILNGAITLTAGMSTPVPKAQWEKIKANEIVRHLLEKEKLRVVKSEGEVPVNTESSVDLVVPPELLAEEEEGARTGVTAKLMETKSEDLVLDIDPEDTLNKPSVPKKTRGRKSKK